MNSIDDMMEEIQSLKVKLEVEKKTLDKSNMILKQNKLDCLSSARSKLEALEVKMKLLGKAQIKLKKTMEKFIKKIEEGNYGD